MKKFTSATKMLASLTTLFFVTIANGQLTRHENRENKVAILPIVYIGTGNDARSDEMRYRLQNIAWLYLREEAIELKFQSPAETNALLLRNGVNEANFRQFTPRELAEILQVEYVLTGLITQEYTGQSASSNSQRRDYDHHGRRNRFEFEQYRTREQLATHIDLDIFNDKGDQIFSRSRRSILTDVDAYMNGIQYLLKRSPLYKR